MSVCLRSWVCVCVFLKAEASVSQRGAWSGRSTIQTVPVSTEFCRCYSRAGGNDGECGCRLVSVNRVLVAEGPCKCFFFGPFSPPWLLSCFQCQWQPHRKVSLGFLQDVKGRCKRQYELFIQIYLCTVYLFGCLSWKIKGRWKRRHQYGREKFWLLSECQNFDFSHHHDLSQFRIVIILTSSHNYYYYYCFFSEFWVYLSIS